MDKSIPYHSSILYYRDGGKGLPILLIHGFAEDGTIWDELATDLEQQNRVIIPDLPGSGRSPLTDDTLSMEGMAETLKVLLDKEKIDKCVLIGHSMGGYVSLAFAEKYPDQLLGLGLFHSTAYADSEEKKEARKKSIAFIRSNGSAPFIRQSIPGLFSENSKQEHPEWANDLTQRYLDFSPLALTRYYEAMIARPDRTSVLLAATLPVLFVIGGQDTAVPPQQALEQSHLPAISQVSILEKTAHMGMMEESERSRQLIHSFLNLVSIS